MAQLVDDLRASIPAAFEAEEHQARRNLIESELKERHEQAFQALRQDAQKKGLALGQSPTGFVFVKLPTVVKHLRNSFGRCHYQVQPENCCRQPDSKGCSKQAKYFKVSQS